ncbi:MAG: hypothetical protein VB025_09195 [Sphaerochaeta sp.]|nr:hypothetical protein [Sphaerochaeta sp.]
MSRARDRRYKVLQIDVDTAFGEQLEKFGEALPKILNFSMGDVAHDMAAFIRDKYLSGNPLEKISGETFDSTRGYQPKDGQSNWFVDFGVRVTGQLNYLHKWAGTRRDFMTKGKRAYESGGGYMRLVEENLERMGRKLEVL